MTNYYYWMLIITAAGIFLRGWVLPAAIMIGGAFFLFVLPTTGFDYDYYKQAYDNAYYINSYPWFVTESVLTAEPLYIWYSSFVSVLIGGGFAVFLVVNFLVCFFIINFSLKKIVNFDCGLLWLAFLPIVFPTIFYFSPRSSLSFSLVMLGFFWLADGRWWKALLVFFVAISFHSQYLLVVVTLLLCVLFYEVSKKFGEAFQRRSVYVAIVFVSIVLVSINLVISFLPSVLSFLPSADIAIAKLHYFESEDSGYRATMILSVFVYPVLLYFLLKLKKQRKIVFVCDSESDRRLCQLVVVIVLFGAMVNLVMLGNSHVAGRLARFSDYFSMGVIVPLSLRLLFAREGAVLILFFLALVSPFIYGTVYTEF